MILLFKLIILTSICVLAFKIVTSEKMLLDKLGEWAENKVNDGNKIFELLVCPWCQPTLFSWIGFGFAYGIGVVDTLSWQLLWYYPLCIGGSSLTCGLIWTLYTTMESKKTYYDNAQKYYYLTNKKMSDEKRQNSSKK